MENEFVVRNLVALKEAAVLLLHLPFVNGHSVSWQEVQQSTNCPCPNLVQALDTIVVNPANKTDAMEHFEELQKWSEEELAGSSRQSVQDRALYTRYLLFSIIGVMIVQKLEQDQSDSDPSVESICSEIFNEFVVLSKDITKALEQASTTGSIFSMLESQSALSQRHLILQEVNSLCHDINFIFDNRPVCSLSAYKIDKKKSRLDGKLLCEYPRASFEMKSTSDQVVVAYALHHKTHRLYTAAQDKYLYAWDLRTMALIGKMLCRRYPEYLFVHECQALDIPSRLLTIDLQAIQIYDIQDNSSSSLGLKRVFELEHNPKLLVMSAVIHGSRLYVLFDQRSVTIVNLPSLTAMDTASITAESHIKFQSFSVSEDGKLMFIGCNDSCVRIWNTESLAHVGTLDHNFENSDRELDAIAFIYSFDKLNRIFTIPETTEKSCYVWELAAQWAAVENSGETQIVGTIIQGLGGVNGEGQPTAFYVDKPSVFSSRKSPRLFLGHRFGLIQAFDMISLECIFKYELPTLEQVSKIIVSEQFCCVSVMKKEIYVLNTEKQDLILTKTFKNRAMDMLVDSKNYVLYAGDSAIHAILL